MKPSFRKKPYTTAEMNLLYEQNVGFKKLVDTVNNSKEGYARPFDIINDAVNVSTSLGNATGGKKYYHPASIMYTMFKATKHSGVIPTDGETLALMTALKKYSRYAYKWAAAFAKLDAGEPYLYKKRVHPHHPPAGGAYRGFPLSYLDVRVPRGTSFDAEGRLVPTAYRTIRINFQSAKVVADYGKVWIGVDASGKRMFLASEKKPRIDLMDFLKAYGESGFFSDSSGPRIPLDLDRVVAAKELPASLR